MGHDAEITKNDDWESLEIMVLAKWGAKGRPLYDSGKSWAKLQCHMRST